MGGKGGGGGGGFTSFPFSWHEISNHQGLNGC